MGATVLPDGTSAPGGPEPERSHPWRSTLVVAAVSFASLGFYTWLRRSSWQIDSPMFFGACQRLRESGLPITSSDLFCPSDALRHHANDLYMMRTLLTGFGLAIPCAILAAAGRRFTAFLPLLVTPWIGLGVGSQAVPWWGHPYRGGMTFFGAVLDLALLGAPALAIMLVTRRGPPRVRRASRRSLIVVGLGCLVVSGIVALAFNHPLNPWGFFNCVGNCSDDGIRPLWDALGPLLCLFVFGALLGPDRRWWPWSLAVVALFMSQALPALFRFSVDPPQIKVWSFFGAVVPLFLVGLIGSAWQPLGGWLDSRRAKRSNQEEPKADDPLPSRRYRLGPVAVLNAGAVVILVVSVLMYASDPVPAWFAQPLPTFSVPRDAANNLRIRMDLQQALSVMDRYRHKHGTYEGFDAMMGSTSDPSLAWFDGIGVWSGGLSTPDATGVPDLVMFVIAATRHQAKIAAASASGAGYCIQHTSGGGVTYGTAGGYPSTVSTLRTAIARCGDTPWTAATTQPAPQLTCDPNRSAYLLCRMVQVLIVGIMKGTKPDDWNPTSLVPFQSGQEPTPLPAVSPSPG